MPAVKSLLRAFFMEISENKRFGYLTKLKIFSIIIHSDIFLTEIYYIKIEIRKETRRFNFVITFGVKIQQKEKYLIIKRETKKRGG